jgi:hypothetical protein
MSGALKTPKARLAPSNNSVDVWENIDLLPEITKFLDPKDKEKLYRLNNDFWKNCDVIMGYPLPSFFKADITEKVLQNSLAKHCLVKLLGITDPSEQAINLTQNFSQLIAQYCTDLEQNLERHLLPDCSAFLWASLYASFPTANLGFYLQ